MSITVSEIETAVATFLVSFLSAVTVAGTSYIGAAEVGGLAALGILGYHVAQGNISPASTAPPA